MLDQLVIIADEKGREVDSLPWMEGDFTIGEVNSFELKVPGDLGIKQSWFLMVDETEYGGIVDDVEDDSTVDYITVSGRTWHGMLADECVEPDKGKTHIVLNGEVNQMMGMLIQRQGMEERFVASTEDSGFRVTNYQFLSLKGDRFSDLYTGFRRMLRSVGAKLVIKYDSKLRKAVLSATERGDYINDGLDGEVVPIKVKKTRPYNDLLCLGAGEGTARLVLHVYADEKGKVTDTQTIFGTAHRETKYENVNCDEWKDLHDYGVEQLIDMQSDLESCSLTGETAEKYDVDDLVGAKSVDQEMEVITHIAEKTCAYDEDGNVSYKTKTELEVN